MKIFYQLRYFALPLALLFSLGCVPELPVPQPVSPLNLAPYSTQTISVSPAPVILAIETEIPLPTPTPFTYAIASGDTLSTLAERFGLRLDDLMLANPGIIPGTLSVGQLIKIPSGSSTSINLPVSTPAPLDLGRPVCYPAAAGSYCLVPAHNPYPEPLENVKLQITLFDPAGQALASQLAFLPLDILPSAETLPAYAFFPAPGVDFRPSAQLITSIRLLPGDARYLPAIPRNLLTSVDWNGRSAQVEGQVFLPPGSSQPASQIWLVAVAYDANDQIIGFRRLEWSGSLSPGGAQPFALPVYSFGPLITRLEIVIEARP